MHTWIALLRGVNVGGNAVLPMKDLRAALERRGYANVATYIQSGNCVFQSACSDAERISKDVAAAIHEQAGFRPSVLMLSLKELDAALAGNPFPAGNADPKSVHIFFLGAAPSKADVPSLEALCEGDEAVVLSGTRLYTYTPEGIGRSKMAAKIGKFIPAQMTGRNLRSVGKIAELARSLG